VKIRNHCLIAIVFMTAALFLGGCGGIDINRYAGLKPQFDLYSYFEGTTRGWGMVLNRQGAMTRQFTVDIVGSVNDEGSMILDEQFLWNDGKRERRVVSAAATRCGGNTPYPSISMAAPGISFSATGCSCSPTGCCLIELRCRNSVSELVR